MLFGTRAGFGLEFHLEGDAYLLCVDVFVGGLHVNTWDNAFYPPPAGQGAHRRVAALPHTGRATGGFRLRLPGVGGVHQRRVGVRLPRRRLDPPRLPLHGDGDTAAGTESVATVTRAGFVETLERSLAVAEREWEVRRARLSRGG